MNSINCFVFLVVISSSLAEATINGAFIQVGDFHYDPTYDEAGDSCNMVIAKDERKPYGNYHCDAPRKLMESALNKVNNLCQEKKADFVMWAGDMSLHVRNASMLDTEGLLNIINETARLLRDEIHPDYPIYPMMGNHDYFPKSQLPTSGGLYQQIADIFCPIFDLQGDKGCNEFVVAGYYSRVIDNKLMLLITNNNLYQVGNKVVQDTEADPAGQFAWMRKKLGEARQKKYRVHVFAHIPPGYYETSHGVNLLKNNHNSKFIAILRDYSDVIIGVYSAHTHTDSFRIIYKEKEPVVPLLISPSITPWRWAGGPNTAPPRNPALRVILYDNKDKMHLTNYEQYYLHLQRANQAPSNSKPQWDLEYKFTSYQRADNVTAVSLHEVADEFTKYASEDFHKYFERNSVLIKDAPDKPSGSVVYTCSKDCKVGHICAITNVEPEPYEKCLKELDVSSAASTIDTHAPPLFMSLVVLFHCTKIFY